VAFDGTETQLGQYLQPIEGHFNIVMALPPTLGEGPVLLDCLVEEHHEKDDHRPLGILLHHAYVLISDRSEKDDKNSLLPLTERAVALLDENLEFRAKNFSLWVGSLNALARRRTDSVEADFATVRGPHSAGLQQWLAEHGGEYDTVLVQ